MPLQATSGAASYDAFGGGAAAEPNYIESCFSTWLYTGTGVQFAVTNNINMSSGALLWIKRRNASGSNRLYDSIRDNVISSNNTAAQANNNPQYVSGVSTTGFTVGTNTETNASGGTYAAWSFREQAKFFDIVTYTGTGANRTIAHNLGAVPGCIIIKCTSAVADWRVYHRSNANTQYLTLNTNSDALTGATIWNSTTPTSTVFSVGTDATVNASGSSYVAYIFAHDAGGFGLSGSENVVSCGTYTGNGSATGPIVTLGYEPQWLLIKRADSPADWYTVDNMRGLSVVQTSTLELIPNNANAENADYAGTGFPVAPLSTGFQLSTSVNGSVNANGAKYIYIAIRRGPMKVPTSGTSVFSPVARTGTGATASITAGFPVDLIIDSSRVGGSGSWSNFVDRLRGNLARLTSVSTNAEQSMSGWNAITGFDSNTAVRVGSDPNGLINSVNNWANWMFKRAPSFMDVVCYSGTGVARTVAHNLTVAPELMIIKSRPFANSWAVYYGNKQLAYLESSAAGFDPSPTVWNNTVPTSSVFSVGNAEFVNQSGNAYVAYLFATCAGVSKVGSYTGNGSSQTINCGFTGGARFVMVKATSTTGNWIVADSARGIVAGNDPALYLNSTAAEVTGLDWIDADNSGFVVNETATIAANTNGVSYIFFAVA